MPNAISSSGGSDLKSVDRQSGLSAESLSLFILALLLLVAGREGWTLSTSNDAANGLEFSADEGFLFEYAIVSIGMALSSMLLRLRGSSLIQECRHLASIFGGKKRAAPEAIRADWFAFGWIVLLIGIAAVVGLCLLGQPVRYDEAFTYLTFIEPGGSYLFYYPLPNNHVLYTLLASASSFFFGSSPVSLRWPALAFSLAAVVLAFRVGRMASGKNGGYLAASGVALCPILVSYSVLARGYSLQILLVLAMLAVVFDDARFPWKTKPVVLALLAAAALFVMPSAAYMVGGIALWAAALRVRKLRGRFGFPASLRGDGAAFHCIDVLACSSRQQLRLGTAE